MFITVSLQRQQHFTSSIRILQLCCFLGQIDLFSLCALFPHVRSRDDTPENPSVYCCPIRHVHISHNAPYYPPPPHPPPQILHKHCFKLLLGRL